MMMIDKLREIAFLDGLDEVALADIAILSEELTLDDGEALISENESENHIYFLVRGKVEVTAMKGSAVSSEVVISNEDTELFGEMTWLTGDKRSANVRCVGDVVAIRVDGPRLMDYLAGNTKVGFILMRRIAQLLSGRLKNSGTLLKQMLWNS